MSVNGQFLWYLWRLMKMNKSVFRTETKEEKPVLAICYDFDKTLSPDDMQAQGFIQSVGYDIDKFWEESNRLAQDNDMDQNLAYMYKMSQKSHGKFFVTKEKLMEYGAKVQLYKGVEEWFERIRGYGYDKGVLVEHYIISSGLKEMILGTKMAKSGAFKKIYASSFCYDDDDVAFWPAQVINYTNKTQFLFRIEKGVLDINDDSVNDFFPPEKMRVPFRNIVYIGDSATDIPCMKLVNSNGGHSIGVYNPEKNDKARVYNMFDENRIKYYVPADYSEDGELDILIKTIIDKTSEYEKLEEIYNTYKKEAYEHRLSQDEIVKDQLVISLVNSRSFASTHSIIEKMSSVDNWNEYQLEQIIYAAVTNGQIKSIINDTDVRVFFQRLINKYQIDDKKKLVLKKILSEN